MIKGGTREWRDCFKASKLLSHIYHSATCHTTAKLNFCLTPLLSFDTLQNPENNPPKHCMGEIKWGTLWKWQEFCVLFFQVIWGNWLLKHELIVKVNFGTAKSHHAALLAHCCITYTVDRYPVELLVWIKGGTGGCPGQLVSRMDLLALPLVHAYLEH